MFGGGTVERSFNLGNVVAGAGGGIIGGSIFGSYTIKNCYNAGTIAGSTIGGIVGIQSMVVSISPSALGGLINNSYNSGTLSGNNESVGGIIGLCGLPLRFENCYYLNTTANAIGSYAQPYDNKGNQLHFPIPIAGKLGDAQMAMQSSFDGFDFGKLWCMNTSENYKYPVFQKEQPFVLPAAHTLTYHQSYTFSNEGRSYIKWESSNPKVLTIDATTGRVATHKTGQSSVKAIVNGHVIAECKVSVRYSFVQWLLVIFLFGWLWL